MKVYRAIPDAFVTNERLEQDSIHGLEGIFYQAGYSSFVGKMGYHDFNTLSKDIKSEGKYFYLFAEDAILEANSLISGYHKLKMDTCLVVEYDIPEEFIFKLIGYGDYTENMPVYLIETYINKSDFGKNLITTGQLSISQKNEILINAFNESLKRMIECESPFDIIEYSELFDVECLESIINNEQKIFEILSDSNFYKVFMKQRRELIKSTYITSNVVPVNNRFLEKQFKDYNQLSQYYQSKGIQCDFSNNQTKAKEEILYYLSKNKDKEKAKSLLLQIKK